MWTQHHKSCSARCWGRFGNHLRQSQNFDPKQLTSPHYAKKRVLGCHVALACEALFFAPDNFSNACRHQDQKCCWSVRWCVCRSLGVRSLDRSLANPKLRQRRLQRTAPRTDPPGPNERSNERSNEWATNGRTNGRTNGPTNAPTNGPKPVFLLVIRTFTPSHLRPSKRTFWYHSLGRSLGPSLRTLATVRWTVRWRLRWPQHPTANERPNEWSTPRPTNAPTNGPTCGNSYDFLALRWPFVAAFVGPTKAPSPSWWLKMPRPSKRSAQRTVQRILVKFLALRVLWITQKT